MNRERTLKVALVVVGLLFSFSNAKGNATGYAYDALNRPGGWLEWQQPQEERTTTT